MYCVDTKSQIQGFARPQPALANGCPGMLENGLTTTSGTARHQPVRGVRQTSPDNRVPQVPDHARLRSPGRAHASGLRQLRQPQDPAIPTCCAGPASTCISTRPINQVERGRAHPGHLPISGRTIAVHHQGRTQVETRSRRLS